MDILLAIKPDWVQLMISGSKTVELRSSWPQKDINRVFIYESKPARIIRYFLIPTKIVRTTPNELWPLVKDKACVTEQQYNHYYLGRKQAVGIFFDRLFETQKQITPKQLDVRPQGFAYLAPWQVQKLM